MNAHGRPIETERDAAAGFASKSAETGASSGQVDPRSALTKPDGKLLGRGVSTERYGEPVEVIS
jgi:hypothetical protein